MSNKVFSWFLCVVLVLGLSAQTLAETQAEPQKSPVTIRFLVEREGPELQENGLPSRSWTRFFKKLAAMYTETHPEVSFEWIDTEDYDQYLFEHAALHDMPDMYVLYPPSGNYYAFVSSDNARAIPADEFKDYGFREGALDSFTYKGELYAVPMIMTPRCVIYNKTLFEQHGVKVPETMSELLDTVPTFASNGIIPFLPSSYNGHYYRYLYLLEDIVYRLNDSSPSAGLDATVQKIKFSEAPIFSQATDMLEKFEASGLFGDKFRNDPTSPYDLFLQGKLAMLYDANPVPTLRSRNGATEEFLETSVRCMPLPLADGMEPSNEYVFGGSVGAGLAIGGNTEHYDVVLDILKEWLKPEVIAKQSWEGYLGIPVQKFDQYITGAESSAYLSYYELMADSKIFSSTQFNEALNQQFINETYEYFTAYITGNITASEMWTRFDESAAQNQLQ